MAILHVLPQSLLDQYKSRLEGGIMLTVSLHYRKVFRSLCVAFVHTYILFQEVSLWLQYMSMIINTFECKIGIGKNVFLSLEIIILYI